MFRLFKYLDKKQKKRKSFEKTDEYRFFLTYRNMLFKYPKFRFLYEFHNEFDIFRANVIIQGLINKKLFEDEINSIQNYASLFQEFTEETFKSKLQERTIDQPYLLVENIKIYIPFFAKNINLLYYNEPEKLLAFPYNQLFTSFQNSIVDPFDTYGDALYDSHFARLVKLGTNGKETAYFHYDLNYVYIVNAQGRLDVKIVLFDKYIKKTNTRYMLERLQPVIDAYFANDRKLFIENLHKNQFISHKMVEKINKKSKNNL